MSRFLKSIIILLLTATAGSAVLQAQTHYSSNVSLGVKGGVETSRIFFNPAVQQGLPFGATAGLMFRYIEESHFGLVAECNFAQRGWKNTFEETDYKYRRTVNYIEVPVLAHIYFGRRGRFFANVGPQVGFMIGESTSKNFDPDKIQSLPDFPFKNSENAELTTPAQNKVDFGISAGLGGEFSINRRNAVAIEARFYYGIGNLFHAGRRDPFRASNSMAISVTAGYWFRIK